MTQPLIVVGMHRSGTSMLTRILATQGLFLGRDASKHAESLFFHSINQRALAATGADWDRPESALAAMDDLQAVDRVAGEVAQRLRGWRTWQYLGARFLRSRGAIGPHLSFPWGFKDPRSALLLPAWLAVFPDARILRIRRHGIDVAASVIARELRRERLGRCVTIADGVSLWADYEDALDRALATVPPDRQMTLRFEEYAAGFAALQPAVNTFAGLPGPRAIPDALRPDPQRNFAYRTSAELRASAVRFGDALRLRGYDV